MIKKILFLIILFQLVFVKLAYSQSKTEYEKKVDYLFTQFLIKLGVNSTKLKNNSGEISNFFNSLEIINLLSTPKGMILMEQFNKELKNIEKYKTEVDLSREKLKKELEEKKKREKIKNQELSEKRDEAERMIKNSDKTIFERKLKEIIDKWLNKDEFESTNEFQLRINDSFKDFFNKACIYNFNNFLNAKSELISLKLDRYDADNERYYVMIRSRSSYNQFKSEELQYRDYIEQQFRGYLKISINEAKVLKEMYGSENPHYENWINGEDKVKCYVEDFKNVFLNYLPKKIKLFKSQESKNDYYIVYLDYEDIMLEEIKYRYVKDGETFGFDWENYVSERLKEIENKRVIQNKQIELALLQEKENKEKFNFDLLNQTRKLDSLYSLKFYNDYEISYKQIENLFSSLPKGVKGTDYNLPINKVKKLRESLNNDFSEINSKFEYSNIKLKEEINNTIYYGHNRQLSPKFKKIALKYLDFLQNLYKSKVIKESGDLQYLLNKLEYTKMWTDFNFNFLKYFYEDNKDKLKLLKDEPSEDIINKFNN